MVSCMPTNLTTMQKLNFQIASALLDEFIAEISKKQKLPTYSQLSTSPSVKKITKYGKDFLPYLGEYLRYFDETYPEVKKYEPSLLALCNWITIEIQDLPGPTPNPLGELRQWITWLLSPPLTTYTSTGLWLHQTNKDDPGFYGNIFDMNTYATEQEAIKQNDYAIVKTLQSNIGVLLYQVSSPKTQKELFVRFTNQDPRFGEDYHDNIVMQNAVALVLGHVNPELN